MSIIKNTYLLSLIVFFSCGLLYMENVMAADLVTEVLEIRRSNKSAQVDVSHIVEKYIEVGVSMKSVDDFLRNMKFVLNYQSGEDGKRKVLIATFHKKNIISTFFYDEIKIVIYFNDGFVEKSNSKLIFRTL